MVTLNLTYRRIVLTVAPLIPNQLVWVRILLRLPSESSAVGSARALGAFRVIETGQDEDGTD